MSSSTKEKAGPPSKADAPPRPEIPPGHLGPVHNPNCNDVLSGRGGRINSHTGNVRFREMVESLKRDYLDPRTKKLEKARIAARLVSTIRRSDPSGRFLKEDPHTGLWIEIGDERAWKKAGQALRESAPEIRAEQQNKLHAAVAAVSNVGGAGDIITSSSSSPVKSAPETEFCEEIGSGGEGARGGGAGGGYRSPQFMSPSDAIPGRRKNNTSNSFGYGSSSRSMASSSGRSSRQASDPPGPRHRPNPPEREGLARPRQQQQHHHQQYEQEIMYNDRMGNTNCSTNNYDNYDDREFSTRMRQQQQQLQQQQQQQHYSSSDNEYQRMEQERQYAKLQLQERYREVYEHKLHQRLGQMEQSPQQHNMGRQFDQDQYDYRQKQQQLQQLQQQQQQQQSRGFQPQEIAAAFDDDDLLPVHAGFVIPSIRGDPQPPSQDYAQQQMQKNYQQFQQQRRLQQQQQQQQYYHQNGGDDDDDKDHTSVTHHTQAFDNFNPISSGASVSTMASFDASMDMSSLGGFSFNQSTNTFGQSYQSNHNSSMMSGLISTGSQMSRGGGSMARGTTKNERQRKSSTALERKLEKVNMEHRRQQAEEMEKRRLEQGVYQVPTGGGENNNPHDYSFKSKLHDQSLTSFGFEAIEEDADAMTEASYKLSNLGLSEMSVGNMTFNSEVLSIKSRADGGIKDGSKGSTPKPNEEGATSSGSNGEGKKRSGSDPSDNANPSSKNGSAAITSNGVFDQSISSNGTSSKSSNKSGAQFDFDHFNESFRSMEMEDRGGAPSSLPDPPNEGDEVAVSGAARGSSNGAMDPPRRRQNNMSSGRMSSSRQQDPSGGRLPTISRGSNTSAAAGAAPADTTTASRHRRESDQSNPVAEDFGVSLNSIRSFQSNASDASSWLNQYNAMEEIGSDKNPWDDEESRGSSMSEISAPRMVSVDAGGRDV